MTDNNLIFPRFRSIYDRGAVAAFTFMRVFAGIALMIHGYPKIMNPTGAAGMVEGLGFFPGAFWSILLSCTEFLGGLLLAIGLLTRPAAAATAFILLVTVYAHWVAFGQGYDGAEKSILWFSILLYLAAKGGGPASFDRIIRREV